MRISFSSHPKCRSVFTTQKVHIIIYLYSITIDKLITFVSQSKNQPNVRLPSITSINDIITNYHNYKDRKGISKTRKQLKDGRTIKFNLCLIPINTLQYNKSQRLFLIKKQEYNDKFLAISVNNLYFLHSHMTLKVIKTN